LAQVSAAARFGCAASSSGGFSCGRAIASWRLLAVRGGAGDRVCEGNVCAIKSSPERKKSAKTVSQAKSKRVSRRDGTTHPVGAKQGAKAASAIALDGGLFRTSLAKAARTLWEAAFGTGAGNGAAALLARGLAVAAKRGRALVRTLLGSNARALRLAGDGGSDGGEADADDEEEEEEEEEEEKDVGGAAERSAAKGRRAVPAVTVSRSARRQRRNTRLGGGGKGRAGAGRPATTAGSLRVARELREFQRDPPPGCAAASQPGNDRVWVVTITGAPETLFAGEKYKLRFEFPPGYPSAPPSVYFLKPTPRHQHVYTNGDICLDLLGKGWRPQVGPTRRSMGTLLISDPL